MNNLSLKYFLLASETLNFTKAAQQLHISQQALSSQIQNLEAELGVELFYRGKKVSLTYAGIRFINYARQMLSLEERMKMEMSRIANRETGVLRVAMNATRSADLLPEILSKFYENYPYVEIITSETSPSQVEEMLVSGKADLSVGLQPYNQEIAIEELYPEMLVAIIPKIYVNSVLGNKNELKRKELIADFDPGKFSRVPTIMLARGMQIRTWVDHYLKEKQAQPNIFQECVGVRTMLLMALKGLGMAYCSETFLYSIKSELQKEDCPVNVFPILRTRGKQPLGVCYFKEIQMTSVIQYFIQLMKDYYYEIRFVYDLGNVRIEKIKEQI